MNQKIQSRSHAFSQALRAIEIATNRGPEAKIAEIKTLQRNFEDNLNALVAEDPQRVSEVEDLLRHMVSLAGDLIKKLNEESKAPKAPQHLQLPKLKNTLGSCLGMSHSRFARSPE